ncbi:MAG: GNAT family N-acetyltransferase [Candidatus Krumholzibacteriia bacterium]
MSGDLEFGWAGPGDLDEVEAFHVRHFGADSIQALPGRVRWLYFDNPLGLHLAVCRDGGELVACCGHLPQPVAVAGTTVTAGFGIDFMVAPSHRRRGIGRRFLDLRTERFPLSLSTGQSPAMLALYRASGAVELGPLFVGLRRRRPPLAGSPRDLAKGWALWAAGLAARGCAPAAGVRTVDAPEAAALAGGSERAAWFRWRYGGPVYADHGFLTDGAAAAVWREQAGIRTVVGLAGAPAARAGLLAAAARRPGAAWTRVPAAGDALRADLRRAGYLVRPLDAVLVALTRDAALQEALRPGALDLDGGAADTDLLRRPPVSGPARGA